MLRYFFQPDNFQEILFFFILLSLAVVIISDALVTYMPNAPRLIFLYKVVCFLILANLCGAFAFSLPVIATRVVDRHEPSGLQIVLVLLNLLSPFILAPRVDLFLFQRGLSRYVRIPASLLVFLILSLAAVLCFLAMTIPMWRGPEIL